jgi:hypothetical protein
MGSESGHLAMLSVRHARYKNPCHFQLPMKCRTGYSNWPYSLAPALFPLKLTKLGVQLPCKVYTINKRRLQSRRDAIKKLEEYRRLHQTQIVAPKTEVVIQ